MTEGRSTGGGSPDSREVEVKFRVADLPALRMRLVRLGAVRQHRVYEQNLVFDQPDRRFQAAGQLLRLRRADEVTTLTFKSPLPSERFKVRQEIEVHVDDFERMRALLEALGYQVTATYEKYRESWRLGMVEVELDELAFGTFVEIEGTEAAIESVAGQLGFSMADAIAKDYLQLAREADSSSSES